MITEMTVLDLIKLLQTFPSTLTVAYCCCSEQCIMEANDIYVMEAGEPRPDGWIHDKRPNKPTRNYLVFPGN